MILGEWARWLNGGFIAASTLLFCIACLSVVFLLGQSSFKRSTASFRETFLWGFIVFPWFAASAISVLVMFPGFDDLKPLWLLNLTHWHHTEVFDTGSWHSVPLAVAALLSLWLVFRALRGITKHINSLALFNHWRLEQWRDEGQPDHLATAFPATAFTYGLLTPRVFISHSLKAQLTTAEQQVVARHEQRHVNRRDPLKKFLFSCFAAAFPRSVAAQLKAEFSLSLEQGADAWAAQTAEDRALVAKTLLKVYRLSRANPPGAYCAFSGSDLTDRVHYLMTPASNRPFHFALAMLLFFALFALSLLGVDSYHHSFEQLFRH